MSHASALDVASYILSRRGPLSTYELQKLVYFAQAWTLTWDGRPLFAEEIQAWPKGPVVPRLFTHHRTRRIISDLPGGSAETLTEQERATVDAVLDFYGHRSADELVEMTHQDQPWIDARRGLPALMPSKRPISERAMRRFYTVKQVMGEPAPTRPGSPVADAPTGVALEEASRQMKRWRSTLDWLAVR